MLIDKLINRKTIVKQSLTSEPAIEAVEAEPAMASEPNLGKKFFNWRTAASFAFAFLIIFFMVQNFQNIRLEYTLQAISRAVLPLYLLGIIAYYLSFPIRGIRWRYMLKSTGTPGQQIPGWPVLGEIVYLSWFANSIVPAKLGDIFRAHLLKKNGNISLTRCLATILAERIVDLAVLLILVGLGLLLGFRDRLAEISRINPNLVPAVEIGMTLLVLGGITLLLWRYINPFVERFVPHRFVHLYHHFTTDAFSSMRNIPLLASFGAMALLTEPLRLYFVTRAIGYPLGSNPVQELLSCVVVGLVAAFVTVLPGTGGGLGYVEAFTTAFLTIVFKVPAEIAFAIVLLDRSISYGSVIIFGFIDYIFTRHK